MYALFTGFQLPLANFTLMYIYIYIYILKFQSALNSAVYLVVRRRKPVD